MSGTIIITGGASGIGLATAELAREKGLRVAVIDLPGAALDQARAAGFATHAGDITDEAAINGIIDGIAAKGPIWGLVNSAGTGADLAMLETSPGRFSQILNVNVLGSFIVSAACARHMRQGGGSIVNISSVSGIRGNEGRVAYGASKGAVIAMTKVMAVELAGFGIRVNAIAPGPVETPLVAVVHTPEVREAWAGAVPMRRYGATAEIAAPILFLLDEAQSSYVTGQVLSVDGGFMAAGIMSGTSEAGNRNA
jgi:NAD(P)-dependent dehydrogenase (short-subunit alcohol dehydrogenase family)